MSWLVALRTEGRLEGAILTEIASEEGESEMKGFGWRGVLFVKVAKKFARPSTRTNLGNVRGPREP